VKEYGMDRSQKAESVAALNAVFNEVGLVVVTRNLGLTVAQSTVLRTKMRDAGASYKVAKNRLAKLAIKDTNYEAIGDFLNDSR
jgi:large subunit ribosomal protein L10